MGLPTPALHQNLQNGSEIVSMGISASAQPTAKTKVRGAERPPQERLSPKSSGSQPKNHKAKVHRESKPMVWLREGNVARVGVNAETRLLAAARQVIDRNNVETLNSICDKVLAELGVTKEQAYTDVDLNRTVRDRLIHTIIEHAKEAAGLSTAVEISEANQSYIFRFIDMTLCADAMELPTPARSQTLDSDFSVETSNRFEGIDGFADGIMKTVDETAAFACD
jgi:hypothetical protein